MRKRLGECFDCIYYRVNPANIKTGVCRKNPPAVVVLPGQRPGEVKVHGFQAPVTGDGGCGEFTGREE